MDSKQFGQFIGEMRRQKGYTQKQLAELIFVSDKAVSKWECGLGFPDIKILQPLSEALSVSLVELMSGKRYVEKAISTDEASQSLEITLDCSKREKLQTETKLLLIVVSVCFMGNLLCGGLLEMLFEGVAFAFTFQPAYHAFYSLRYIFSAIALLMVSFICFRPQTIRWRIFSLIACGSSILSSLIAIICYLHDFVGSWMDYALLVVFALAACSVVMATYCIIHGREKVARALLYVTGICACASLWIVFPFSYPLYYNLIPVQLCKFLILCSPFPLLAICMKLFSAKKAEDDRAKQSLSI